MGLRGHQIETFNVTSNHSCLFNTYYVPAVRSPGDAADNKPTLCVCV